MSKELERILLNIEKKHNTLITGPPGVGKSWLLMKLYDNLILKNYDVVKLAPTNAAARRIAGQTIHSFFRINPFSPNSGKFVFTGIVIIDEISMVHKELFEYIYVNLPNNVFILFGDFCQLPPVAENGILTVDELSNIFKKDIDYKSDSISYLCESYTRLKNFMFNSSYYQQFYLMELNKVYRTNNIELLDFFIRARNGELNYNDFTLSFQSSSSTEEYHVEITDFYQIINKSKYTILCSTYGNIENIYKAKSHEYIVKSKTEFKEDRHTNNSYYYNLYFYKGQKVKFIIDVGAARKHETGYIADYEQHSNLLHVSLEDDPSTVISVCKTWHKDRYNFPIQPMDVMTIHKAQGQEFDYVMVIVDHLFEIGHFYTAITRAKQEVKLCYLNAEFIKHEGFNRTIKNIKNIEMLIPAC